MQESIKGGRRLRLAAVGVIAVLSLVLIATPQPGRAQSTYPTKPIDIVVPFAAGGSTDLGARILAEALQQRWNVPVRVINRPGGNTVPGVDEVMRAAADGSTILMDGPGSSSMLETVVKNLPFKAMDRTFLALAAQTPLMLVVPSDSPWKTLADAVHSAKENPSQFSWTSGAGTTDLTFRQLFHIAGVNYRQTRAVQVKGGAEAINLVAGGHVNIGVGFWGSISALASAGKLRVLAVAGPERFPAIPDVPTTAQAGLPDLLILQWIGFSGPPGLKEDVIKAWSTAVADVVRDAKVISGLERVGLVPFPSTPQGMKDFVTKEGRMVEELWRN